ncbi:MAG TPA: alpha/beta hydrolase [Xanthobacteraceae bacterium]|nr:alpha/beta hydrolase [Xanthobacteraceae bacterium]
MTLYAIPANPVPEGAVEGYLVTPDGLKLRYARWNPIGPRRGTVCLFSGRTEMIEKYFEVVNELRQRGLAVAALDWRGQGGSERMLDDPRKGHVRSFDDYQMDLEVFMREIVLPDCPAPIFGLAHSMGGAILLEAIRLGRRWFDRLVLSSPMIELVGYAGRPMVRFIAKIGVLAGLDKSYIFGGGPAPISSRPFANNPLTTDPVRYERIAGLEQLPGLGLGSPTFGWTNAAFDVMQRLSDPLYPTALRQPLLIFAAGDDPIASTIATERFSVRLRAGAHLVIPGARHEILMERDAIRAQFWAAFDAFVPGPPLYR